MSCPSAAYYRNEHFRLALRFFIIPAVPFSYIFVPMTEQTFLLVKKLAQLRQQIIYVPERNSSLYGDNGAPTMHESINPGNSSLRDTKIADLCIVS